MKALMVDYMSDVIDKGLEERGIELDKVMLPTSEKLAEIIEPYDFLFMRVDLNMQRKKIFQLKTLQDKMQTQLLNLFLQKC